MICRNVRCTDHSVRTNCGWSMPGRIDLIVCWLFGGPFKGNIGPFLQPNVLEFLPLIFVSFYDRWWFVIQLFLGKLYGGYQSFLWGHWCYSLGLLVKAIVDSHNCLLRHLDSSFILNRAVLQMDADGLTVRFWSVYSAGTVEHQSQCGENAVSLIGVIVCLSHPRKN